MKSLKIGGETSHTYTRLNMTEVIKYAIQYNEVSILNLSINDQSTMSFNFNFDFFLLYL